MVPITRLTNRNREVGVNQLIMIDKNDDVAGSAMVSLSGVSP